MPRQTAPAKLSASRKARPPARPGKTPLCINDGAIDMVAYIADMAEELEQLSLNINEATLAYLLGMARAEAALIALKARNSN